MSFSPAAGQPPNDGHVRITPLVTPLGSGSVRTRNSYRPYVWLSVLASPGQLMTPLIVWHVWVSTPLATLFWAGRRTPLPPLPGPLNAPHFVVSRAVPLKSSLMTSFQV